MGHVLVTQVIPVPNLPFNIEPVLNNYLLSECPSEKLPTLMISSKLFSIPFHKVIEITEAGF